MITQSFLCNAIFFTYALVLTKFYHVSNDAVPVYGLAFAVGNLAGPLLLGHLFYTLGRKKMIAGTYLLSGSMLAASAWLFDAGVLHAAGQTFIWIVVFLLASAGASAGYLTVSEIFPIEIRADQLLLGVAGQRRLEHRAAVGAQCLDELLRGDLAHDDHEGRRSRPHQVLDALFEVVLL